MKRVFIDANIVLDFLDKNRKFHNEALGVINKIIDDEWTAVISEDLLTTIYYVAKDKQKILDFFSVILDSWDVVSFGKEQLMESVNICQREKSLDFEDVNQSLCARKQNCHLIVTNDRSFYQCGIPLVTSLEF
ncbi:MAG: type II toxin-antitoxin system VapC family toxin [Candidatus Delongbacteria bacterium]|nr:type II toxin-antitoxin system VapC family toxin [Candidatus Delongbacteria bacterium]